MRLIKLGIISLLVFGCLLSIISLLIPSGFSVIKSVSVKATEAEVATYLRDLRQWQHWNLLIADTVQSDTNTTVFEQNRITTPRFKVEKEAGEAYEVVTKWYDSQREFTSIMSYVASEDQPGETIIQWYFNVKTKWYPWEKFASMVFDKQLDRPMEISLARLKNHIINNR